MAISAVKAVALLKTSGTNVGESMKIEEIGNGNSPSSMSFRPAFVLGHEGEDEVLRSRLSHMWRIRWKRTAGLTSCINMTNPIIAASCVRTSVVWLSSRDDTDRLRDDHVKAVTDHVVQTDPWDVPELQRRAEPVNLFE